jgi:hypothetical protein
VLLLVLDLKGGAPVQHKRATTLYPLLPSSGVQDALLDVAVPNKLLAPSWPLPPILQRVDELIDGCILRSLRGELLTSPPFTPKSDDTCNLKF